MPFQYATTGSGPSAGGIGWFNFGNGFTLTPGQTVPGLTGTLANGIIVTFDLTLTSLGGSPRNFAAVTSPIAGAYFGLSGYTGIAGTPILYSDLGTANNLSNLVFSNITVTDAQGNPMPNYTVVVADAENTSGDAINQEGISLTTNGGGWTQLAALGNTNPPTIVGGGTFIGFIGVSAPPNTAYVYTSQSPKSVTVSLESPLANLRQGIAIGFAATQVELYKNIAGRRYPADQFNLGIAGGPAVSATTTGASNGLQSVYATTAAIPGTTYTLNELMAAGSVSALSDYTQSVTAVNLTPGGTTPVVTLLPETITPILGDIIQYTILNTPDPVISKSVTPAFAQPGQLLTYTVTVTNPDTTAPATNILVVDPAPAGTTYANNLAVSVPYTGIDPVSGITLTSIPAGGTATITWQVQVNNSLPAQNPISNVATVTLPDGSVITTNAADTQINSADLTTAGNFVKTATPAGAATGDTVTYTLTVTNSGNVAANNVVITDPIPAGTTYVANSVTGTVPFTGTPASDLTLTSSIPAGGSAAFTFQVKIGNTLPVVNPIPNTASVQYTFTVDPAQPNGASGSGNSNTALVTVGNAKLSTVKTADKFIAYPGSVITYHLAVTNSGNLPADNVVITDPIPGGTTYVPGSLTMNVPFTGSPLTAITLTNPIAPGQVITASFQVQVGENPNPNPVRNVATVTYAYTIDPQNPDSVTGTSTSNRTTTAVFQNNYSQQINDLIESVALQEAALAAIMNAEGAKIQRFASMPGVTPSMLLCLNKSVTEMTDSIALLEAVLKQKLSTVECQINGSCGL